MGAMADWKTAEGISIEVPARDNKDETTPTARLARSA